MLIEVVLRLSNIVGPDIGIVVISRIKIIHAEDRTGIRAVAAPFIAVVDLDHGVLQGIAIKVHQAAKRHASTHTIRNGQAIQHRTERLVGIYYAAGLFFRVGRFVEPISPEIDTIHYEEATVSVYAEMLAQIRLGRFFFLGGAAQLIHARQHRLHRIGGVLRFRRLHQCGLLRLLGLLRWLVASACRLCDGVYA